MSSQTLSTNTLAQINRNSRRYFPHQREREGGWGGSGRRTCLSTHLFFLYDFLQHVQLPGQEGESRGHGQLESKRKAYVTLIFTGKYIVHGDSDPFIYKNRRAASLKKRAGGVSGCCFKGDWCKARCFLVQ